MKTATQKRSRHGLNALMTRVKVRGLAAIDQRTAAARSLLAWKAELLQDLGGEANVSSQKRALIDMAVRSKLFLDHIDAFLLEQPSLVNKRARSVLPLVRERQALADSLARVLSQLGLDRQEKPAPSLADYIREKDRAKESTK